MTTAPKRNNCHEIKPYDIEEAKQQKQTLEHLTRSYDQERLERREICRREQRHALGRHTSSIRSMLADDAPPLRKCVHPPGSLNRLQTDVRTGNRADDCQRVSFDSSVDQHAKQRPG